MQETFHLFALNDYLGSGLLHWGPVAVVDYYLSKETTSVTRASYFKSIYFCYFRLKILKQFSLFNIETFSQIA